MLLYSFLSCLVLLASYVSSYHGEYRIRFHKSSYQLSKNFVIAPESHDDYSNFAVAEYELPLKLPPKLSVRVRIYNDYYGGQPVGCSFEYSARWNAMHLGINSLNRLNDNKLVLTWYEELAKHKDRRTTIVIIDVDDDCKQSHVDAGTLSGQVIVVPSSHNKFDIFTNDEHACYKYAGSSCQLSYNLDDANDSWKRPFNIALDWPTMRIERLINGDLVVHGFDNKTYRVFRIYRNGIAEPLFKFNHVDKDFEFISSGMTFCWPVIPSAENKINCTQYDGFNQIYFTKIVEFDQKRVLVDVRAIRNREIMIVTRNKKCIDNRDCWRMYSTTLREDSDKPNDILLPFACTGNQKDLMVFGADYDEIYMKIDFHYACRKGNGYNFNTFNIHQDFF